MKNIEKIKEMDSAKLADFLVESGAEVPADFCDIVCLADSCKECKFCGVAGIREAVKRKKMSRALRGTSAAGLQEGGCIEDYHSSRRGIYGWIVIWLDILRGLIRKFFG